MRRYAKLAMLGLGLLASQALGSEARTSAGAGSGRAASATASYQGTAGFAHAESRDGPVSLARGVAVGVDEHGVSLSVSNAIAGRFGPAVATSFNLTIGTDGSVAHGQSRVIAEGPLSRSARAGGQTGIRPGRPASASAWGGGRTDRFGRVRVSAHSSSRPGRPILRRGHQQRHLRRGVIVRRSRRLAAPPEVRSYRIIRH